MSLEQAKFHGLICNAITTLQFKTYNCLEIKPMDKFKSLQFKLEF